MLLQGMANVFVLAKQLCGGNSTDINSGIQIRFHEPVRIIRILSSMNPRGVFPEVIEMMMLLDLRCPNIWTVHRSHIYPSSSFCVWQAPEQSHRASTMEIDGW